jgi:exodeoxyribonuclease III
MKILSWNIRQGGGARIDRIQTMIAAHNPEILVLSEFRNNAAGANLRQWLEHFGHQYQAVPETLEPGANSVLVSSRLPFQSMAFPGLQLNAHRRVGARFNGLTLLGLYFPVMEAKRPVFAFLKTLPREYLVKESLIIGDLNTGSHVERESGVSDHSALVLTLDIPQ